MFLKQVYNGKNQWYLYVFSLLILFLAIQLASLPLVAYVLKHDLNDTTDLSRLASISTNTNMGLALTLFPFLVGFWTLLYCTKYIHMKPALNIITTRRRMDWNRFLFATGLWCTLGIIFTIFQYFVLSPSDLIFQFNPKNFFILLGIALLLLPFQTSFEELVFRGYLMQWMAYLFKYRWVAILLSGTLFGLLHISNPEVEKFGVWYALPQYILFGLILGYITVKDNGTELALGFHWANNLTTILTVTSDASALQTHSLFKDINPTANWIDIVGILVMGFLFVFICNKRYHFIHQNNIWKKI